jgi:hypothetical protein
MIVVPMNDAHVRAIRPQQQQAAETGDVEQRVVETRALAALGPAYAAIDDDGTVLALAGVAHLWDGRGGAWALLSADAGRRMVVLTRSTRRYLDGLHYRRLEMYVDAQFIAGRRWAEMLGFVNETPVGMPGFLPNGNTAFMYGRVR